MDNEWWAWVVLGIFFLINGFVKFQGGISNITGWLEGIGLPGFLAYAVYGIELLGSLAVILGLATCLVSALFALIMIGATLKANLAVGFYGQMAGWELNLAFLPIAV
ncbi:hypothetical protein BP422_15080 [Brevibacillus formosus]|uniref:DoxX family protein n=1 Tax=Brevibacillus formosus TaxID=54913 RepID=A0A220MI74_9BACL|nr:hypothetical protein BP422_15080 [Brevibacillus formosus]